MTNRDDFRHKKSVTVQFNCPLLCFPLLFLIRMYSNPSRLYDNKGHLETKVDEMLDRRARNRYTLPKPRWTFFGKGRARRIDTISKASTSRSKERLSLLDLPEDIRKRIYTEMVGAEINVTMRATKQAKRLYWSSDVDSAVPGLLRTCKTM
jgi:hypothetical protein